MSTIEWPAMMKRWIRIRDRLRLPRSYPSLGPRAEPGSAATPERQALDIAPDDPIIDYFQQASGAVDIGRLDLPSPALQQLRAAGVKLVVPLVSQGELIGLLNLGPRLSEHDYSTDDRRLLDELASHAAPALRVAQLVRQRQAEVRERERLEQELRVARMIQRQFLPKEIPNLPGWQFATAYRPARAVGGDFYDLIELAGGRVALVAGDVSDKGIPAALVMATTRSVLRGEAARSGSPSAVLGRANDLLFADIPATMFATCFYGVLDPESGRFCFANAGHNPPYLRTREGVSELRATGMPLGMLPGTSYDEAEIIVPVDASLLFHSDGLVEAHNQDGELLGFPRLQEIVGRLPDDGQEMIDALLAELERFTGPEVEQEDDITIVVVRHLTPAEQLGSRALSAAGAGGRLLAEFELPSVPGNVRVATERVLVAIRGLGLDDARVERLKTAVSEATMNAIEHGNRNQAELMVGVQVRASSEAISIRIIDQGGERPIPDPVEPDLDAKLRGLQSPRGWGLFLIKNMVDDVRFNRDESRHVIELILYRQEDERRERSGAREEHRG